MPQIDQLQAELKRERYKYRFVRVFRSTLYTLIVVAAFAILVATLWMPVLQIYGSSMNPTLREGEIVLSVKANRFEVGDVVAFYHRNRLLVKRYIAGPGSWVNITGDLRHSGMTTESRYRKEACLWNAFCFRRQSNGIRSASGKVMEECGTLPGIRRGVLHQLCADPACHHHESGGCLRVGSP